MQYDEDVDDTFEIVARGNLHVLEYLKDQFETHLWLQKYCLPAIQYGQMEILKWLKSIGCTKKQKEWFLSSRALSNGIRE